MWQPIETAPKDGRLALVALSGGDIIICPLVDSPELTKQQRLELAKAGAWPDHRHYVPTHWMPLSEPPKSEMVARSETSDPLDW